MKTKYVIFLTIFMVCGFVYADEDSTFRAANDHYLKGDFKKAIDLYQSIDNKGSATWYNIGNCSYKLGDYINALIYWHSAKRTADASDFDAISYNIQVVEQKLEISGEPESVIERFYALTYNKFRFISLFLMQLIVMLLWLLLFFFIKIYKRGKKNTLIIGALSIATIFCVVGLQVKYRETKQKKGIVMKQNAALLAGPCQDYHKLTDIAQGFYVEILHHNNEWIQVVYKGIVGWIPTNSLAIV